jgi:hypothetical protein
LPAGGRAHGGRHRHGGVTPLPRNAAAQRCRATLHAGQRDERLGCVLCRPGCPAANASAGTAWHGHHLVPLPPPCAVARGPRSGPCRLVGPWDSQWNDYLAPLPPPRAVLSEPNEAPLRTTGCGNAALVALRQGGGRGGRGWGAFEARHAGQVDLRVTVTMAPEGLRGLGPLPTPALRDAPPIIQAVSERVGRWGHKWPPVHPSPNSAVGVRGPALEGWGSARALSASGLARGLFFKHFFLVLGVRHSSSVLLRRIITRLYFQYLE